MGRLKKTARGAAAIAAVVAATAGGYTMYKGYKVHDDVALAAEYLVGPWEGRRLVAYLDTLARPPVWTICDGDTNGVKRGDRETPEGCDKRLMEKMERQYRPPLVACIPNWEKQPLAWRSMMLSLGWNIGTSGACRSTAARIVRDATLQGRAPDYIASCQAATAFNKSGGQVRIGLVNRREMGDRSRIGEGELCRSGVE